MKCLVCPTEELDAPQEHIVPHSMGNERYILTRGIICKEHNNLFSQFEAKALTKTILGMERTRLGIRTKKGKPAKSKTGEIEFSGDTAYRKNFINIKGLKTEDIKDFNPLTGIGKITVQGFDKTEVPTAKLILKIGLESLFQSQPRIFLKYDFEELKDYLINKSNKDWPFLITKIRLTNFKSIPRFCDKHNLKKVRCELAYSELNDRTLLFNFRYVGVSLLINLICRNKEWSKDYLTNDKDCTLYPINLRNK